MFEKKFILYHKEIPVVELFYKEDISDIKKIGKVFEPKLLPDFLKQCIDNQEIACKRLNWWIKRIRCIPNNRPNIESTLKELKVKSTSKLAQLAMGFAMTDSYWYGADTKSGALWKKANYFENQYSTQIGQLMVNGKPLIGKPNWNDPSITVNGQQNKMWLNVDGENYLLKVDDFMTDTLQHDQAANEIVGQAIAEALGLVCAEYHIVKTKTGKSACLSKNFASQDTEFVPLAMYVVGNEQEDRIKIYKDTAMRLGISEDTFDRYISKMTSLFSIEMNADFNLGNIGFMLTRDGNQVHADMGIIFDNGNSNGLYYINDEVKVNGPYWSNSEVRKTYNRVVDEMTFEKLFNSKTISNTMFGKNFDEISKHIQFADGIDMSKLKKVPQIALQAYASSNAHFELAKKVEGILKESIQRFELLIEKISEKENEFKEQESIFPLDKDSVAPNDKKGDDNVFINEKRQDSRFDR